MRNQNQQSGLSEGKTYSNSDILEELSLTPASLSGQPKTSEYTPSNEPLGLYDLEAQEEMEIGESIEEILEHRAEGSKGEASDNVDNAEDNDHSERGDYRYSSNYNDDAGDKDIPEYSDERMTLYTRNLVKIYGKRTVVNNVSIHVRQGEIVGLLGPNGAGKTTSFYMTTGLIVPNGGQVFLNDQEITKYPVARRAKAGIGYLAQEASVFRTMSVEDNIMSVLEMRKELSSKQRREKMEELINEFRLQKVRKNNGNQLSGGERRRCEIARCLAIDPKFIMLDEPFAGVDPIAVEDIQYIVWKLKDRNIGILITDHNVQETLCITDRAYLLFEGRILFKGTPPELSENRTVRDKYLGSNFVLRPKDFQLIEEKKQRESEEEDGI